MASKGTIKSNILESLEALGRDTIKGSFESIKKTFNPLELMSKAAGLENNSQDVKESFKNKKNYTQLDFDKLQKQYNNKDKAELNAYRQSLFRLVKSGEEKALAEEKQKKEQKKTQEDQQNQQDAQKEKQTKSQSQGGAIGKTRRSILGGGKRKANVQLEQSIEYKQNAGK